MARSARCKKGAWHTHLSVQVALKTILKLHDINIIILTAVTVRTKEQMIEEGGHYNSDVLFKIEEGGHYNGILI